MESSKGLHRHIKFCVSVCVYGEKKKIVQWDTTKPRRDIKRKLIPPNLFNIKF